MKIKYALIMALFLVATPLSAIAEEKRDEDLKYLSLSHENDNLGGGTDRFYTSGARITLFDADINVPPGIDQMADKIPTFDLNDTTATFYSLGHNIYTPEDIRIESQPQDDRPWAAFLYGSVGMATATYAEDGDIDHVDELEFTLGVIGPEALGKPIQRFVHKYLSNSPDPRGWKNQLKFEPGVVISWQRRDPYFLETDFGPVNARIEPNFSVSLGNIRTNLGAGATFILGSDRTLDPPPRVRPAVPGTGYFGTPNDEFNWQVFAGFDGRLIGRNIFLDGNTFRDSHSVDKRYAVGDLSAGVSLFYDDVRLSYTLNMRTKEFKTQSEESIFGSLTLTTRF